MERHYFLAQALCAIVCVCALDLTAQTYINKEWVESTGVPDNIDWTTSVIDGSGNLVVVGNTLIGPSNPDVLVTKYDRQGTQLWQQTYGGTANAEDYGIAVTADLAGSIYVAAVTTNMGSMQDITLLKFSSDGQLLWDTSWNGPTGLADVPSSLALAPDGSIFVAGATWVTLMQTDYALVKFSGSGAVLWHSTYDYAGWHDAATAVKVGGDGHPIVTGGSASSLNTWDYATLRYEAATGTPLDTVRIELPGVGLDNALALALDGDGNVLVTGYREVEGNKDIQTIKINNSFGLDWVRDFDGEGLEDIGKSIGSDAQGNVYITGHTRKVNGGTDWVTIKYAPNGDEEWRRSHGSRDGSMTAEAFRLTVAGDGTVSVAGTVDDGQGFNYRVIQYDTHGRLILEQTYDGGYGADRALDILASASGDLFVIGITEGPNGPVYTTLKYTILRLGDGILYDQFGQACCKAGELLVKFRPDVIAHELVDNRDWQHGDLDKLVHDSIASAIAAKLGLPPQGHRLRAIKVYTGMTRADSISITRLEEEERIPELWSTYLLASPLIGDVLAASDSLSTLGDFIEYAEPNHVATLDDVPDDSHYNLQTSLWNSSHGIDVEPAWDIQKGSWNIKVGVLDEVIQWSHPDLGDGTYAGSKVTGGWDFFNQTHVSNISNPPNSHGTACAGIIGAERNNAQGVAGIAGGDGSAQNPGVQFISIGISSNESFIPIATAANAMVEASTQFTGSYGYGCHVLNNSWSGPYNATLHNAVRTAYRNKCVIVAARSNAGTAALRYPACYEPERMVVNVGASGTNGSWHSGVDGPWSWASSYAGNLDIVAPGVTAIVVTTEVPSAPTHPLLTITSGYGRFAGTSAAAPHAAGVAALMLSEHNVANGAPNNLAPEDVERIIEKTSLDVGSAGYDPYNGHGRLQASGALAAVEQPAYRVHHFQQMGNLNQTPFPNQQITILNNAGGLANGNYIAQRRLVTHTYLLNFPPGAQIIDIWDRPSSVIGWGANNPVDGTAHSIISYTINGNTAAVTAQTYCWYVASTSGGASVDTWIPTVPADLRTAISVHVYDPGVVGIEEVATDPVLQVWPSPASQELFLRLQLELPEDVQLTIVDMTGRTVFERPMGRLAQLNTTLPVNHLASGLYSLRVTAGRTVYHERFLKQ